MYVLKQIIKSRMRFYEQVKEDKFLYPLVLKFKGVIYFHFLLEKLSKKGGSWEELGRVRRNAVSQDSMTQCPTLVNKYLTLC